jgi:cytochrome P450
VSEGSEHERARKMLNPAFHFVKLQSMISIMVDQTSKSINELILLSTEQEVIDLQTELNTLTLAIIASSAFGKGFETVANAKQIVCRAFTELIGAIEYRTMRMIDQIPVMKQQVI